MPALLPFLKTIGYIGIFAMLFAETGLLVGVVLPGDTLLFSAGLLASQGYFNIGLMIVGASMAAIIGDSTGYWTGQKFGPKIFAREESIFFKKSYVVRAQAFFDKHGRKTIFLARYIPIVRTFTPIIAGVAGMPYRSFAFYNILGGIVWCTAITLAGYFLGARVPNIDAYILPAVGAVFVLSFIPVIVEVIKRKRGHAH
jgi:membrane-associated protein